MEGRIRGHEVVRAVRPSTTVGPPLAKAVPSFQCSLVSELSQGNENLMHSLQQKVEELSSLKDHLTA